MPRDSLPMAGESEKKKLSIGKRETFTMREPDEGDQRKRSSGLVTKKHRRRRGFPWCGLGVVRRYTVKEVSRFHRLTKYGKTVRGVRLAGLQLKKAVYRTTTFFSKCSWGEGMGGENFDEGPPFRSSAGGVSGSFRLKNRRSGSLGAMN